MLLAAERPVILVGQGVKYGGAAADLLRLAERLRIPVAWSASGTGAIDTHHPLALGLVARNGPYQANHAARTADVLLALGVRFDDRTSSSWLPGYSFTIPPTKLIHVDIDPDEIARNYPVALGLMADVRTFLRQLLAELDSRRDRSDGDASARRSGSSTIDGYRKQWNAFIAPGFSDDSTPDPPAARRARDRQGAARRRHPGERHRRPSQLAHPVLQSAAARFAHRLDGLRSRWGSALPACLGAQFAAPDRPCVSVCGDGAFFMHASVLGTAVEYNLPVVWVVWNNFAYASIRGLQRGYLGGRELATDFRHPETGAPYNPDFAAMARSAGDRGRQRRSRRRPFRCAACRDRGADVRPSSMPISAPTRIPAAPAYGSCRDWARASPPSAAATSLDRCTRSLSAGITGEPCSG